MKKIIRFRPLLSEIARQQRQQSFNFLPQNSCPRLSFVVVKKSTLRQRESPQCGIKKIM